MGGARRQEQRWRGQYVAVVDSVLVLVLLVCLQGPLWVYGGTWWPECPESVQWGWQLVLERVVVVVRVCRLCVAS